MLCLLMWFSGGLDSVKSMIRLNDHKGLLQPKQFCDSVIVLAFTKPPVGQVLA